MGRNFRSLEKKMSFKKSNSKKLTRVTADLPVGVAENAIFTRIRKDEWGTEAE